MQDDPGLGAFRPPELTTSKLRFYSMGICAENKARNSMEVEVTPTEELTMLDGEINTQASDYKAKGEDTLGKTYDSSVQTQNSVKATWLRFGDANRMSAPDVRRGEPVMLYQFGDSNKYYWMTIKQDIQLRRLETFIWAISASPTEGDPMDAQHCYFLEVSSHDKHITLSTSKKNGEPFAYKFQLNTKEGIATLTDDVGNYFILNSKETRLEMMNISGSHWDMEKDNLTVTIPNNVLYEVGNHFTARAPKITLDGVTNITKDTTMEMNTKTQLNTLVQGGLSVTQETGSSGDGKNRLRGGLIIEDRGLEVTGESVFHDQVNFDVDIFVAGYAHLDGGYTDQ